MKKILLFTIVLFISATVSANVKLPKIFGDNMVLQRDHTIPVWGWAASKEKITIRFNKQTKSVTADKAGKWRIDLDAEPAGGPYQLVVTGKNNITISNILVGDVWICSGQSNMEWPLLNTDDAVNEIKNANYPQIRHFEVTKAVASQPMEDVAGGDWKICSPETAGRFTAVGYYFAKELQGELKIPVGLINTSWGGTHVETWTSRNAFERDEEFKSMISAMPSLNLDSMAKQRTAAATKRIEKLQPVINPSAAIIASWKDPSFNDDKWPKIKAPGVWEEQALPDFDGIVWLRKTVTITAADAGKPAVLELAMIDDKDDTYVNGTKVGGTGLYNAKRHYTIPAGILKEGKNVVAVRVEDTGGGGGIYGEAADVKLSVGATELSLAGDWLFQIEAVASSSVTVGPNSYPTLLSNAMIEPLIPFAIKGAIWYQGETNAGRAFQYRKAFPLMITDWRKRWKQGDFPFYFVQLATFNSANGDSRKGSAWAELREAQTLTLSLPATGMAVTTDIGNPKDIHPRNKRDVGKRLAAVALNKTYGKGNVYSGPAYQSFTTEGDKIILSFSNTGSGLSTTDKYGYLKGFEIAGADKQFYYARAYISGDKVIVQHDKVKSPVAVRFGWADDASDNNLFNKEGFPAGPFRTDDWKGITETAKYRIGN
ncbi:MAG: sialate O-acetylesterase [Ferruginibacter sp.]